MSWQESENDIDYAGLYEKRFPVLKLAFSRSAHAETDAYRIFCEKEKAWLDNYSQFMAIKMSFGGKVGSNGRTRCAAVSPKPCASS